MRQGKGIEIGPVNWQDEKVIHFPVVGMVPKNFGKTDLLWQGLDFQRVGMDIYFIQTDTIGINYFGGVENIVVDWIIAIMVVKDKKVI